MANQNKAAAHDAKLPIINIIHGTALYLIAYVLVYTLGAATSVLLANVAGKNPVLFYNKLLFVNSTGWNVYDAIAIFGSPLAVYAILSMVMLTIIRKTNNKYTLQKPFILWILIHTVNRLAGCVLPGMLSNESFKYMADWLYIGPYGMFVFSIASVVILIICGGFLTKMALQTAVYSDSIKSNYRKQFLREAFLIPWFIGTIGIIAIQLPTPKTSIHEVASSLQIIVLLLPMFFYLRYLHKKPIANRKPSYQGSAINLKLVIYALVLLTGFRLVLGNGIYF